MIQEAPYKGQILTLAHYSGVKFSDLAFAMNFGHPGKMVLQYPSEAIAMTNSLDKIISIPSPPGNGNSFKVAYGSKQPAAP